LELGCGDRFGLVHVVTGGLGQPIVVVRGNEERDRTAGFDIDDSSIPEWALQIDVGSLLGQAGISKVLVVLGAEHNEHCHFGGTLLDDDVAEAFVIPCTESELQTTRTAFVEPETSSRDLRQTEGAGREVGFDVIGGPARR
jgi:hypothetical protein